MIQIQKDTAVSLKELKITKSESYDEIIIRLIDEHELNMEVVEVD